MNGLVFTTCPREGIIAGTKESDLLIKSADDKSKRLALFEDLQRSPLLDRRQQEWLSDELHRTKRGIAGERDAAHYLDNYLKDDPHRALLHDLRFIIDGDVVQIDHMVISRSMFVYLLETKNFNGNLRINEFGDFSVEYSGERVFGIPSPMEPCPSRLDHPPAIGKGTGHEQRDQG